MSIHNGPASNNQFGTAGNAVIPLHNGNGVEMHLPDGRPSNSPNESPNPGTGGAAPVAKPISGTFSGVKFNLPA